jgi:hypothetical protein
LDDEAIAEPNSVPTHQLLIEALGGDPGGFQGVGFLSSDGGAAWTRISSHAGAPTVGALATLPEFVVGVAEAWDTSRRIPEPTRHRLRFHIGPS